MISRATPEFWACFDELPESVQAKAKAAYALWNNNPRHPSLQFKPVPSAVKASGRYVSASIGERSECVTAN